ncbi:MAG: efflux RND transporter periplasmic adaptor subunit [bacterium]
MKELLLKRVLPVLIVLAIGAAVALMLMRTKPQPQRGRQKSMATLVEVMEATPKKDRVVVEAMGTVMPARKITITPQVAGKIKQIHPDLVPGGLLDKGEVLVKIDERDYVAAKDQAWSQVEQAKASLQLEQGMQSVAQREYELMQRMDGNSEANTELALREPQLKQAKARLSSAYASYKKARLNLERTDIEVPWNAVVLTKDTEVGQFVNQQTRIATLAGTDTYWVEATIQSKRLPWINLPGPSGQGGSKATVIYNAGGKDIVSLSGKVIKLLADMEPQSRMARLLIEVKGPLEQLKAKGESGIPLLLNSYVRAEIQGKKIEQAYKLPRKALREGDRVWIMNDDKELTPKDVKVAWKTEEEVLVTSGIETGDKIITSRIISPLPGMKVTEAEEYENASMDSAGGEKTGKPGSNSADKAPAGKGGRQ